MRTYTNRPPLLSIMKHALLVVSAVALITPTANAHIYDAEVRGIRERQQTYIETVALHTRTLNLVDIKINELNVRYKRFFDNFRSAPQISRQPNEGDLRLALRTQAAYRSHYAIALIGLAGLDTDVELYREKLVDDLKSGGFVAKDQYWKTIMAALDHAVAGIAKLRTQVEAQKAKSDESINKLMDLQTHEYLESVEANRRSHLSDLKFADEIQQWMTSVRSISADYSKRVIFNEEEEAEELLTAIELLNSYFPLIFLGRVTNASRRADYDRLIDLTSALTTDMMDFRVKTQELYKKRGFTFPTTERSKPADLRIASLGDGVFGSDEVRTPTPEKKDTNSSSEFDPKTIEPGRCIELDRDRFAPLDSHDLSADKQVSEVRGMVELHQVDTFYFMEFNDRTPVAKERAPRGENLKQELKEAVGAKVAEAQPPSVSQPTPPERPTPVVQDHTADLENTTRTYLDMIDRGEKRTKSAEDRNGIQELKAATSGYRSIQEQLNRSMNQVLQQSLNGVQSNFSFWSNPDSLIAPAVDYGDLTQEQIEAMRSGQLKATLEMVHFLASLGPAGTPIGVADLASVIAFDHTLLGSPVLGNSNKMIFAAATLVSFVPAGKALPLIARSARASAIKAIRTLFKGGKISASEVQGLLQGTRQAPEAVSRLLKNPSTDTAQLGRVLKGAKNVTEITAESANASYLSRGLRAPHSPEGPVLHITEVIEHIDGYRAYGGLSPSEGRWISLSSPKIFSKETYRAQNAIPPENTLEKISRVKLKGESINISISNPISDWGTGGAVQIELVTSEKRIESYLWSEDGLWKE